MNRPRASLVVLVALLLASVACTDPGAEETRPDVDAGEQDTIDLTSPAFEDGETIPTTFTCDGEDVSPPLAWSNVPDDAEELVLIVEDPDAPRGTFVHWVVAGIEPEDGEVGEGEVPPGGVEGTNDFEELGYRGPCPPPGDDAHTYEFVLYAVSEPVEFEGGDAATGLRDSITDITVATGRLTGTYARTE